MQREGYCCIKPSQLRKWKEPVGKFEARIFGESMLSILMWSLIISVALKLSSDTFIYAYRKALLKPNQTMAFLKYLD
jgi:hypothetical protein